jgi:hypothetical protein
MIAPRGADSPRELYPLVASQGTSGNGAPTSRHHVEDLVERTSQVVAFFSRRGGGYRQAGGLLVGLSVLLIGLPALAQQEPKWGPYIDLEAKPGTKRSLGEGDAFIPLAQDAATLLFASLRYRFDDNDSNEGNYGLGVRRMLESGWNLGAYSYFDRRRTEFDNHFNQVTLGIEALSQDWDLRANYYAPIGRRRHQVDSLSTAEISGTTVVFRGGEERSMGGFDAEIGWRVPLFDARADKQFRIFGGAYHFSESDLEDITGPRARAELTFDSVPYLWEGSRFSLGAEWQHDDPRGSQGFLTARLRIPLQVYGKPASSLTPMERRMADPTVRDIDVVSRAGAFGAPEVASVTADGQAIVVLSSNSSYGTDLTDELTTAGANSTVILSGSFNTTAMTTMQAGQTLMGAGTLRVRSASGRVASLATPAATIAGVDLTGDPLIETANNTTLSGLTINATNSTGGQAFGVRVLANNVRIVGNTITANHTAGISSANAVFIFGNDAIVDGNILTATNAGANDAFALSVSGASATITGNTLSASGSGTNYHTNLTNAVIRSGSAGNRLGTGNTGTCNNAGGGSGFVGYSDGTANCNAF